MAGFALVSVLAILVLLMVLVLSISSVVHVETRSSASGRDLLLARQNALLGLDIAIGQLQEYAGKDQAVTFPATTCYPAKDVTAGTGALFDDATFGYRAKAVTAKSAGGSPLASTYLTPNERAAWDGALKDWWNDTANAYKNPRNPRWTGIMDASFRVDRATTGNATALAAQRYEESGTATKFGEPKRDQLPVWLVSGNEKFTINQETGAVADQSGAVVSVGTYPAGYFTPDTALADPAADPSVVWLVGEGSATLSSNSTDGLDGRVKAKKQDVIAAPTAVGGNGSLTGHYAYWVGDESTKANFAARDRTSKNDASYPNDLSNTASKEYRNRLQVPQRIGWENIPGFGNATFSPNDPYLENISTSKEIGLLQAIKLNDTLTQQVKDAAKSNFHSLTAFSKSLLTDTALGGLKKDLTVFLEGTGGPAPTQSILDPSRYLTNDPRLGANNTGFPATTANLPVWQDVKTWHGAMGAGGGSVPVTKGISPVFANFQLFCAVTHSGDKLQFHMIPVIALWNPYDASLQNTTYNLQWRHNFCIKTLAFAVNNPACPPTPFTTDVSGQRLETSVGTKVGNYFISPLARIGTWFTAADKYAPFRTAWETGPQAFWVWVPAAGQPYGANSFTPFDKKPTQTATLPAGYAGPPMPDDPAATWVTYQFTSNFAPGEVKVFTVDGMQPVADPGKLHDGSTVIRLKNGFDPQFPSSYYFDFAQNLQRQPGVPLTDADEVRWYGEYISVQTGQNNPVIGSSVRLTNKDTNTTLWTNYYAGVPDIRGNQLWANIQGHTPETSGNLLQAYPASDPSQWRKVYTLAEWPTIAKGTMDSALWNSPLVGLYRSSMNPFLTNPAEIMRSQTVYLAKGISCYYRAFATFNPFASEGMDLIRDLDYARDAQLEHGAWTTDNFSTLRPLAADPKVMIWDNQNASGTNGFAVFGWQASDANNNLGLSTLAARLVRPTEINTVSLGQLQQVNLGRYFWQPSFVLGNSEASPYVDRAKAAGLQAYPVATVPSTKAHYAIWVQSLPTSSSATHPNNAPTTKNPSANAFVDLSYLVNENVWDSYFLSTIPQTGAIAKDNSTPLNNGRHRFRADVTPTDGEARDWQTSAAFLENYGALNVNSTSVEAWKAVFTAFRRLSISSNGASNPDPTVPVSRTLSPINGPLGFTDSTRVAADYGANSSGLRNYSKLLNGFRYLTDTQIQSLSERIVDEIRLRGPFLSLADFVNRRLVPPQGANSSSSVWYKARTLNSYPSGNDVSAVGRIDLLSYDPFVGMSGINGALQRAINVSGINGGMNDPLPDVNNRAYGVQPNSKTLFQSIGTQNNQFMQQLADYQYYLDAEHLAGVPAGEVGQLLSHSPGFVSQGDLLAMVGPALTPRGDTFLIRTYGDSVDKTGKVLSRAYIEAVVQRVADPVTPAGTTGTDKWRYTDKFGRKFKVVNLRWLRPEDI